MLDEYYSASTFYRWRSLPGFCVPQIARALTFPSTTRGIQSGLGTCSAMLIVSQHS